MTPDDRRWVSSGAALPHALALLLSERPGAVAVGAFPSHVERAGMGTFWEQVRALDCMLIASLIR